MILSPRLRFRRWRLKYQAVPHDGQPLAGRELRALAAAERAWHDKAATARLALGEMAAEILARGRGGGRR